MPHALLIQLDRARAPWLPDDCTDALHAQVFTWLGQHDKQLARHLHDHGHEPRSAAIPVEVVVPDTRFPKFTVAPALAEVRRRMRRGPIDGYYITLLADGEGLFARLSAGMCDARQRLGEYCVEVNGMPAPLAAEPHPVDDRSYAEIQAGANEDERIRLRFTTPVSFTVDKAIHTMPDPVHVFRGYADRWNAFVIDEALKVPDPPAFAEWLRESVEIEASDLWLESRVLKKGAKRIAFRGSLGEVQYALTRRARADDHHRAHRYVRTMNMLADFAEFCGTGRMAAQGFGQTWRLSPD
jgi:hypothetical protein